jgi:hypothetical protein
MNNQIIPMHDQPRLARVIGRINELLVKYPYPAIYR